MYQATKHMNFRDLLEASKLKDKFLRPTYSCEKYSYKKRKMWTQLPFCFSFLKFAQLHHKIQNSTFENKNEAEKENINNIQKSFNILHYLF